MALDKKLLSKFTEHLFRSNIRFLLLIQWPELDPEICAGKLTYFVNGKASDILNDVQAFVREIEKEIDDKQEKTKK